MRYGCLTLFQREATMKTTKVKLGNKYTENVHGRVGKATALCDYLTGCTRVCLEWLDKDGKVEDVWVDVTQIKEIAPVRVSGGPQKTPPKY